MMKPTNEAELSDILSDSREPIRIVGGGTRQGLGNAVSAPGQLSTSAMTGVTLFEPAALTMIVRAGTSLTEVQKTLKAENQQLPFEPMDHGVLLGDKGKSTIGGVVACNISGSRRIQVGACRDSLIGVRFVDGAGTIVKNGGRVMKNVTGYDLVKLMAGSYGTLGVMTELSFKLQPMPETSATLTVYGLSETDGVSVLCRALGSPNDVNGAAFVNGKTLIRVEGLKGSVAYRTEALKTLFSDKEVTVENGAAKNAKLWNSVGDVAALAKSKADIWRLSVKPTDGPKVVAHLRKAGVELDAQYDWGGGLVYLAVSDDTDIRKYLSDIHGHVTLIRGNGGGSLKMPIQNKLIAGIEAGLRSKFDPRGILNTGIMG
jgi:glycolate oxidase FAD binding subunit